MNKKWIPIILIVIVLILIVYYIYQYRYKVAEDSQAVAETLNEDKQITSSPMPDEINNFRIQTLHPSIRSKVQDFIAAAAAKGINLRITSGYRTYAEQQALYNQGRTTPGAIVTKAKPGESLHNFGLAIDVVPIVNGKADWNYDWQKIADIAKPLGFEWGGDWTSFKDKPHFQMLFDNTLASLRSKYDAGDVSNGYVNLA